MNLAWWLGAWVLASTLSGCAPRGEQGYEYRWSTEHEWRASPGARPDGDDEFLLRTSVPPTGPHPMLRLYQPPALERAEVGEHPLALGDRFPLKRLEADWAGEKLVLHYRTRFAIGDPNLTFGDEETLPGRMLRKDLPPFGIACAMLVLGLGALASIVVRRSRAWLAFGVFALSMGTMVLLECQDLYSLVSAIAAVRNPVHEASLYLGAASFATFHAEVFAGVVARWLRACALVSVGVMGVAMTLHATGLVAAGHLRWLALSFVAASLVGSVLGAWSQRTSRSARILFAGLLALTVASVPNFLNGLELGNVSTVEWGIVAFVLAMGTVLYDQYGEKEALLEKRLSEVEALNTELKHQIVERSRDIARLGVEPPRDLGAPTVGKTFGGRYQVLQAIGAGAMGQVYEVIRSSDGAHFALKVMAAHGPEELARFSREAEIAASVSHPNLVAVVDVGAGSWGSPFIVMELVRGSTLADGKRTAEANGRLLVQAARGLAALHRAGVVHRDLKPSNVLVAEREGRAVVKLADFGIARLLPSALADTELPHRVATRAGAFMGTPLYMAPEQASGADRVTPAADLFAFGVMAYELWNGEVPFPMPLFLVPESQRGAHRPGELNPAVTDPMVRALLRSCLSGDPHSRPTAEELVTALEAAYPEGPARGTSAG